MFEEITKFFSLLLTDPYWVVIDRESREYRVVQSTWAPESWRYERKSGPHETDQEAFRSLDKFRDQRA